MKLMGVYQIADVLIAFPNGKFYAKPVGLLEGLSYRCNYG